MTRRGFTLIEIIIASALSLIVLGAVIRVYWFGRNVERDARSSYLIREDADVAFRQLQSELRLTHLASVRGHSDDNGWGMASPLEGGYDNKTFELTQYGMAKWKSWVHFTAVPLNDHVGTLVRWEVDYKANTNLPLPPESLDSEPASPKWTVLSNVVLPGRGPTNDSQGLKVMGNVTGGGGLQMRFLRRENGEEVLSKTNPSEKSDSSASGWTAGSTEILDLKLQVGDHSGESGKLSVYSLHLRVKPRN
jgi:prepilin-type N-terminal cleavage/methylation domain-containing protein